MVHTCAKPAGVFGLIDGEFTMLEGEVSSIAVLPGATFKDPVGVLPIALTGVVSAQISRDVSMEPGTEPGTTVIDSALFAKVFLVLGAWSSEPAAVWREALLVHPSCSAALIRRCSGIVAAKLTRSTVSTGSTQRLFPLSFCEEFDTVVAGDKPFETASLAADELDRTISSEPNESNISKSNG
jgi:hypothetical protein